MKHNYKEGDRVVIKTWDHMVREFGGDCGRVNVKPYFIESMESNLGRGRVIQLGTPTKLNANVDSSPRYTWHHYQVCEDMIAGMAPIQGERVYASDSLKELKGFIVGDERCTEEAFFIAHVDHLAICSDSWPVRPLSSLTAWKYAVSVDRTPVPCKDRLSIKINDEPLQFNEEHHNQLLDFIRHLQLEEGGNG